MYLADQSSVGRQVAVKVILPGLANQPEFIRRFETEAQLVARLEHMHITPLYDYWRDPEGAYIVMRYMRGGSLRELIDQNKMNIETISHLIHQISTALEVAHRNQVVHRDIKPSNILLDEDGNAYLADFGIAKDIGGKVESHTQTDMLLGSPNYLSPEQARGEDITPQTDIYSLGATLYHAIANKPPFDGPDATAVVKARFEGPPKSMSKACGKDIPDEVEKLIARMLEVEPGKRYPTYGSLMGDMKRYLSKAGPVSLKKSSRRIKIKGKNAVKFDRTNKPNVTGKIRVGGDVKKKAVAKKSAPKKNPVAKNLLVN